MSSIDCIKHFLKGKADAALIISEENVRYFTSFSSTNGYLLITENTSIFLTDSRYIEAAENTIKTCDEVCEIKSVEQTLAPLVSNLGIRTICVEQSRMNLAQLAAFKKHFENVEFITDSSLDAEINSLRSVKNKQEAEKIEKAQRIAEDAFEHMLEFIAVGKTEREISLELDYTMLKAGADALSFETIVVSGSNGSMPHGVPGNKKINSGDFITMDFGAVFNGYHSDMTRTIAVGEISQKQTEVYNTVLAAQKAGLDMIKAGTSCKEVDKAARDIIKSRGYGDYFGHGFGHGVGIEIHEYPNLSPKSNAFLKSGNVVTAEPGIYIPGEFGVRIEDMVLVTDDGYYNFTCCKKELIVL
ncbi:MAG: aminopeptidase P family protein [Faecalibacterium sp.]|nr:aminopeptidase P family protein [Ruminococcus sp.]MCM1391601.1 aminopeptidase P family protein [Ruminococcus sp.]MCM1485013.1 aminopeptidase P family protein [Faecalibacterium sp.]